MKRLWLAIALLGAATALCVASQLYLHQQMRTHLEQLQTLEDAYTAGDNEATLRIAQQLATEYEKSASFMECFISHNDLENSRETAALLPAILGQDNREEFLMETARLREQLLHLQGIDRPVWRNVL